MYPTNSNNIYFAGPWFTEKGLATMNEVMRIVGSVNNRSKYKVYFPMANQGGMPREVFQKDVEAINNCQIVIALVDEKDCGTAWELGYAYANNKDIYMITTSEETFHMKTNLMLAFSAKACFLLSNLKEFLLDGLVPIINMENKWEGIE